MRRYFIYTYLLLIRYQFYSHFLNLILIKIKNIFTFYKIKEIEKIEKIKSEQLCNKNILIIRIFLIATKKIMLVFN